MEVLYRQCAGLDVHAKSVTACVRIASDATIAYDHYTASTTTRGLLALDAWLMAHGCTHVAMEATLGLILSETFPQGHRELGSVTGRELEKFCQRARRHEVIVGRPVWWRNEAGLCLGSGRVP